METTSKYSIETQVLALTKYADISSRLFEMLLHHYGNLDRILNTDSGTLMAIENMTAEIANSITSCKDYLDDAENYLTVLKQREIKFESRFSDNYINHLLEINDPPSMLYYRGYFPKNRHKAVSICGAENATSEGMQFTVEVVKEFVNKKVQIVSSLRRGIDSSVHLACKNSHSNSFAILDSGFDNIQPEDNISLAIDIVKQGGLITEYVPETEFQFNNIFHSNRIIAGISQAVVITEIYSDSDSTLDLLKCCGEIGKMVFILIDPKAGAKTDETSLNKAVLCGAIPLVGLDKIDDIVKSMV